MPGRSSLIGDAQSIELIDIVNKGIAYAIIIAGFLSVVFIFIGGISFILSGGQEDKIKQAVSTIRYAIIGLIVTILAIVIVNTVGRAIGLNTIEYLNFAEIIRLIEQISQDLGGGASESLR
jgi:uncharacterized membrane protein